MGTRTPAPLDPIIEQGLSQNGDDGVRAESIAVPGETRDADSLSDQIPVEQALMPTSRPIRQPIRLTLETCLYLLLLVAAALTRFWDLGGRALHHDESLHAYYSWLYATGQGYTHDPLMHGPFLFHANALVYLLFGATDASSRFMPALFGVILVGLPYLLRGPRHLGRPGALIASTLLLLSPALLYQSRYIRHDIFTVVGSLLLFIAILRYVELPRRRWLVTIAVMIAFLLTNHEIVFGIVAIFAGVLWGSMLLGRLRMLIPVYLVVAGIGLGLIAQHPGPLGSPMPEIPWDRRGAESPQPTRENQFAFYADLLSHPLIIALAALVAVALVATLFIIARQSADTDLGGLVKGTTSLILSAVGGWFAVVLLLDQTGATVIGSAVAAVGEGLGRLLFGFAFVGFALIGVSYGLARVGWALPLRDYQLDAAWRRTAPWSVERALISLLRDRASLLLALGAGFAVFAILFTSLFTNLYGLVSSTVATDGTLLYWMGQHTYRRGEQPWFYYLLLLPQYEVFALLFGSAATIVIAWRSLRFIVGRGHPGSKYFFQIYLAIWFLAILAALSWAGEKMPWLGTHITLPATILAAALLGEFVESWRAWQAPRGVGTRPASVGWGWPEAGLLTALLVFAGGWFFLAGRLTFGAFEPSTLPGGYARAVTSFAATRWLLLAAPPLVALALLGIAWIFRGARRTGAAALLSLVLVLTLFQVHTAWRMTYLEGDIPKDMLIYTQTSPGLHQMVRELEVLSAEVTGGDQLEIWFDGEVSWPLNWYLRDFPNRRYTTPNAGDNADAPVIITDRDIYSDIMLENYTAREYVLRWWFPEDEIYRRFAIAPELPPHRSAWGEKANPHGLLAIVKSVLSSLATQLQPEGQQRLYRLVMYRDLPYPIGHTGGSVRYTLYIRNDLAPLFNMIHY